MTSMSQTEPEPPILQLDESCVINVLNRTIFADEDGSFALPNVPSNMGAIRARATCNTDDGIITGQTEYFTVRDNRTTDVGAFYLDEAPPTPVELSLNGTVEPLNLFEIDETFQLTISAIYDDGSISDATAASEGTNYTSSNNGIVTVSADGLVTARSLGFALVTIRKDGVSKVLPVNVFSLGDADNDGLPDDIEIALGLDPNDPVDAFEDIDGDGLSALEEFNLGTDIFLADSDGDGISDGEEVTEGEDGFITNPLSSDSDNDGLSDGIEILVGSDPNDINDANFESAVSSLISTPENVVMTFNGIDTEVSTQLQINGLLIDGTITDLTNSPGTAYSSSDLSVASFGSTPGELFGGQAGNAIVSVTNGDNTVDVNVTVRQFEAAAQSAIDIPGYANNVDVSGDYAFVASGAAGLTVVDVSDRTLPSIVSTLDTLGVAIDIKVVGNTAYIADGENGVVVIDVSDVENPVIISTADTAGVAQDLALQLDTLYVADGNQGIEIFDISDSSALVSKAVMRLNGDVKGVAVEQGLLVAAAGSGITLVDVSDINSPIRLSSVNIGSVQDVVVENGFAHVAAYSQGYRVVDVRQPMSPTIVGGNRDIVPRDVALTRNFAFYAEQLFPNVVAFINIFDPLDPVFQGNIDLSRFGDYAGTGIALDASYAYITEERFVVSRDYGVSGDTKLFIAQYRDINDNNGVPPTVEITSPVAGDVVVEGERLTVVAEAQDDIAVDQVQFRVNEAVVFVDTSAPYSMVIEAPFDESGLSLDAIAVDLGGNRTTSDVLRLQVQPDTDDDGLGDFEEQDTYFTDTNNADTDSDRLLDGFEVKIGSNPLSNDSDGDGLLDGDEVDNGTSPTNPDTAKPLVSATQPLADEVDIPETAPVVVTFNEPLDPKSININSIVVSELIEGSVPVTGSVSVSEGNTQLTFTPSVLLRDFTAYQVVVSGVKDIAGNRLDDFVFAYTTGNFVDTVRPSVQFSNPVSGDTNVPTNLIIGAGFSEQINPDTVTPTSVYLYDYNAGQNVDGILSLNEANDGVIFVPNQPLAVGQDYLLVFTSAITDLFSNPLINRNISFRTGFDADSRGPEIVETSVTEGQVAVPTNARIQVRFDEPINPLTLKGAKLTNSDFEEISQQRSLSNDRTLISLVPSAGFVENTTYYLVVNQIEDLGGNLNASETVIAFTTSSEIDNVAAEFLGSNIPNNATDVALNTEVVMSYSEAIDPTSIESNSFYLYDTVLNQRVKGETTLRNDGKDIVFIADEPLKPLRRYYLYASYSPYLQDIAGNLHRTNRSVRFTTGEFEDTSGPEVEQSSIIDGAIDIPVNARIRVLLDERVSTLCLSGIRLTDGTSDIAISTSIDSSGRWLTVSSSETLSEFTEYELVIAGLCDYAGNEISATSVIFTTGTQNVDTTAPSITDRVPATNASNVSINQNIVLTFNEPIAQDSRIQLYNQSAGGILVSGNIEIVDNVLTFTPSDALRGNTQYRVYIYSQVFDFAGNVRSNGNYYFTTETFADGTTPQVVAISPSADAVDVNPNATVVLTFSEPMNASTVNNNNIALYVDGDVIRPSVSRSSTSQEVTLTASKPAASVVSVVITDEVTDLSGNPIQPFISSFVTGINNTDSSRPQVSRQLPSNGSSGWKNINEVLLYMSEEMDAVSLADAVRVTENGVLIDNRGTVEVLADNRTVKFIKDTPFAEDARVRIYVESNATDISGNPVNYYDGYFDIAPAESDLVGVRPRIEAFAPASSATGVQINVALQTRLSEELDIYSITEDTIRFIRSNDGERLSYSFEFDDTTNILTIIPDELLAANTAYYLFYDYRLTDTDGDLLYYNYTRHFTTGDFEEADDRQPSVLSFSPVDGAENVGVNARFGLFFDEPISTLSMPSDISANRRVNVQFSRNDTYVTYERLSALPSQSEITEEAPAIKDLSGNSLVAASTVFSTGEGPDFVKPTVLNTSIAYNATNVPLNFIFKAFMSEDIDPQSVINAQSSLYSYIDGQYKAVTLRLGGNNQTLVLEPAEELTPDSRYQVYITGLTDFSGNRANNLISYFDLGEQVDNTAPVIVDSSIVSGDTEIPTNAKIRLQFNEPLDADFIDTYSLEDELGNRVSTRIEFGESRSILVITPVHLLAELTNYTLTVADVRDSAQNVLVEPVVIDFTTGSSVDLRRDNYVALSFTNNATDVPRNMPISISLSDRVDSTSVLTNPGGVGGSIYLYNRTNSQHTEGEGQVSSDGRLLTFVPSQVLGENKQYDLYFNYSPYLYDLANNRFSSSYRFRFTTGEALDGEPPSVVTTNIADGQDDIPVNARVVVRFNERISPLCKDALTIRSGASVISASNSIDSSGTFVTITPNEALNAATTYSVVAFGVCDYAGNSLNQSLFSFSTRVDTAADLNAPNLLSASPSYNETGVGVDTVIELTFDEPISGNSSIIFQGNVELPGTTQINGNRLIFTPNSDLERGVRYRVYFRNTVYDFARNTRSISDVYFTTED
jgi:methionine-rich copper-binding protein CopC